MGTVCTDFRTAPGQGPQSESPDTPAGQVLAALRERHSSVRQWAIAKGWPPRSVIAVIHTWAGRTDRHPHGGQARQIMAALRAELGHSLVPIPKPRRRASGNTARTSA